MSLRLQINIGILLSVSIILILGVTTAVWQARNSVAKEVKSSVNLAYQLISSGINAPELKNTDPKSWLAQVDLLRQTRHLKIQLMDADGHLLEHFESDSQPVRSRSPDWFIWVISQQYPGAKYPVKTQEGKSLTIVIHPDPMDEIRESWEETRSLLLSIALMAVLMFIAVNLIFNKALSSVTVIVKGLQAIEKGQYQQRIPDFRVSEFGMIARAVNHLTEALAFAKHENRELTRHSLKIQEQERQQLAKELHDEMGQSVTAIKAMAVTGKQANADIVTINNSIISICDRLFMVVRSMMRNLHPIVLSELGLKASLQDLIEHWTEMQPAIDYQIKCTDAIDNIDEKKAIQVFRVIQECLTNIARHAHATQVRITVNNDVNTDGFQISIEDNGRGCDPGLMKSGFGVMAIQERMENIGGKVSFASAPGQGMQISINIPKVFEEANGV